MKLPKIPAPSIYAKAIVAAVSNGYNMFDALTSDNIVTINEWVRISVATVVTFVITWATPNKDTGGNLERLGDGSSYTGPPQERPPTG